MSLFNQIANERGGIDVQSPQRSTYSAPAAVEPNAYGSYQPPTPSEEIRTKYDPMSYEVNRDGEYELPSSMELRKPMLADYDSYAEYITELNYASETAGKRYEPEAISGSFSSPDEEAYVNALYNKTLKHYEDTDRSRWGTFRDSAIDTVSTNPVLGALVSMGAGSLLNSIGSVGADSIAGTNFGGIGTADLGFDVSNILQLPDQGGFSLLGGVLDNSSGLWDGLSTAGTTLGQTFNGVSPGGFSLLDETMFDNSTGLWDGLLESPDTGISLTDALADDSPSLWDTIKEEGGELLEDNLGDVIDAFIPAPTQTQQPTAVPTTSQAQSSVPSTILGLAGSQPSQALGLGSSAVPTQMSTMTNLTSAAPKLVQTTADTQQQDLINQYLKNRR